MNSTMNTKPIQTSTLTGPALDWAVAKAEGEAISHDNALDDFWLEESCRKLADFRPSSSWSQGGPIIERERIALERGEEGWTAYIKNQTYNGNQDGSTPLVSAMRCFVASKMGYTVDIPEEILS